MPMKAIEEAFDEIRRAYVKRESVAREYSKALDSETGWLCELGLNSLTIDLNLAIAQLLKQLTRGEKISSQGILQPSLPIIKFLKLRDNIGCHEHTLKLPKDPLK